MAASKKKKAGKPARAATARKKGSRKTVKSKAKKKKTKKTSARKAKAPARKAAKKAARKKKATRKTARKPAAKAALTKTARRSARTAARSKPPARKKKAQQIVGEGDYAATRAFDADQAAFVKRNKGAIPEMGRQAEAALDGPEGKNLREAEAEALARSRDTF
jgi:hypothetical protein